MRMRFPVWAIVAIAVIAAGGVLLLANDSGVTSFELGRRVYAENCASCHGPNGEGGNPSAPLSTNADGKFPAPPHDRMGHTWHHPDDQLKKIIINGSSYDDFVSEMPAFTDRLSEAEIDAVLAYIKTWWDEDQREFQAEVSRNLSGQFELFTTPTP